MFGRHEPDPWAFERRLGSNPECAIDAKLAAVVPMTAASMQWLGTVQTYLADGYTIRASVIAANIRYPL